MSNRYLIVFMLLGLLVRLLLMPFSLHVDPQFTGDIAAIPEAVQAWNSAESEKRSFLYPPLAYLTFSVYLLGVARPFTADLMQKPIYGLEARFNWLSSPDVFRNLFTLKALYLLPDLGIMILLWKMFQERPARARTVLLLWALNPLVLHSAYFHGQFDLIPLFFVVLSMLFAKKGQATWAALFMGIGACYKSFPFLFLLPLVLILTKNWLVRLKLILVGTLPYILLQLLFLGSYRPQASISFERFFVAGYDLGNGAQIFFFFVLYAILLWYLYFRKAHTFADFWQSCLIILLVYYQFSYFDLHYWVWIIPFAIIFWGEHTDKAIPFYLVIGLFLLVLLAPTPLGRFLAPISPRFFLRLPSLLEALSPYLPMLFMINVVRSLLAGTCFYLAWHVLREMPAARRQAALLEPGTEMSV
jgi:hypothetical protein